MQETLNYFYIIYFPVFPDVRKLKRLTENKRLLCVLLKTKGIQLNKDHLVMLLSGYNIITIIK